MITPFELDNLIPRRITTSQADGAHHRLRPGIDHPQQLHRGNRLHDERCEFHFQGGGGTITGSPSGGTLNGLYHLGMGMSQDHGAP